jgi:hypothetical protein
LKTASSSSHPPTDRAPDIDLKFLAGAGIWLGVFGRVRGVVAIPGVMAREGVWAREGVLRVGIGWAKWDEECVVEFDEVIGDQGRDDAIETLERLLLEGVPMAGTGGISSW